MEADGFVSRRASVETPGVDGGQIRWLGGGFMHAAGGFPGAFSPRMEPDFAPVFHRATPAESSPLVEPEVDYEGLPQEAATSTHMLAGAVAGIMEHCLMYPIDCVKVLHQNIHTYVIFIRHFINICTSLP